MLISLARQAWLSRQPQLLDQTILAIQALPLDPRVHGLAHYYKKLALRTSENTQQTRILLENLVDGVLPEHKPRIMLGLAGCHLTAGDPLESAKTYLEAARSAAKIDALSECSALRGLALIRPSEGDHKGSLADLERLVPVMRSFATSYPEDYRYYLNNLAYELGEVGRIDEAKAAINVALRSPYASRFPDWAETKQELETKERRVFLPLVFALGSAAVLSVPAALENPPATAVTRREQPVPESSAPAQPESQPDIQTSAVPRSSPALKRNRTNRIFVIPAWLARRGLRVPKPLRRQSLKPTFEARGCAKSPPARAPPIHALLV